MAVGGGSQSFGQNTKLRFFLLKGSLSNSICLHVAQFRDNMDPMYIIPKGLYGPQDDTHVILNKQVQASVQNHDCI